MQNFTGFMVYNQNNQEIINVSIPETFVQDINLKNANFYDTNNNGLVDKVELKDSGILTHISIDSEDEKRVIVNYENGNSEIKKVDENELNSLINNPNVDTISPDSKFKIDLIQSIPIIKANTLHNLNITGDSAVCILDTGIYSEHPNFAGRIVNEYCYSDNDFIGDGIGYCSGNTEEYPDANDDLGHGTLVAGIVGSAGGLTGTAPNSKLVVVKVCSYQGDCYYSDLIKGINYCIDNKDKYNISIITLSLGSSYTYDNYVSCDLDNIDITNAMNRAYAAGIFVDVSSGNSYSRTGISTPACLANVTSVGATTKSDTVASYSNVAPLLAVLAPGSSIYSTACVSGGSMCSSSGYASASGTSFASPHVAGSAVLLKQYVKEKYNINLNPDLIKESLKNSGVQINFNGVNYSRIDLANAITYLDTLFIDLNETLPTIYSYSPNNLNLEMNEGEIQEFTISPLEENLTYSWKLYNKSTSEIETNKIAFVSTRDNNYTKIYLMDVNGSNIVKLTDSFDDKNISLFNPVWSLDGTKIAFTLQDKNNTNIYIIYMNGTNLQRLTNFIDNEPVWSPDGKKIAFVSERDGNSEIYVMNSNGTEQIRITNNEGWDFNPAWSPNGNKIVFSYYWENNSEIYIMNFDGTNRQKVTNNSFDNILPVWSPDGSKIAFSSNKNGNYNIYTINLEDSNETELTNNTGDSYVSSWYLSEDKILFDENDEIYIMNSDGSEQTKLTNNSVVDIDAHISPIVNETLTELKLIQESNEKIFTFSPSLGNAGDYLLQFTLSNDSYIIEWNIKVNKYIPSTPPSSSGSSRGSGGSGGGSSSSTKKSTQSEQSSVVQPKEPQKFELQKTEDETRTLETTTETPVVENEFKLEIKTIQYIILFVMVLLVLIVAIRHKKDLNTNK